MNIDFTLAAGVIVTGLVVVFTTLVGLSLLVWLVGKFFVAGRGKSAQPKADNPAPKAAPKAAPMQASAPAPVVEDGIGDEIIAVIAAAVAAMGGQNGGFTLHSVRRAREARPAWAQAGLVQNTQPF